MKMQRPLFQPPTFFGDSVSWDNDPALYLHTMVCQLTTNNTLPLISHPSFFQVKALEIRSLLLQLCVDAGTTTQTMTREDGECGAKTLGLCLHQ